MDEPTELRGRHLAFWAAHHLADRKKVEYLLVKVGYVIKNGENFTAFLDRFFDN